jgi:hypothetical protein
MHHKNFDYEHSIKAVYISLVQLALINLAQLSSVRCMLSKIQTEYHQRMLQVSIRHLAHKKICLQR